MPGFHSQVRRCWLFCVSFTLTLDQESPGSSPGGATTTPGATSVVSGFLSQFADVALRIVTGPALLALKLSPFGARINAKSASVEQPRATRGIPHRDQTRSRREVTNGR